jgi:hypothetical protein
MKTVQWIAASLVALASVSALAATGGNGGGNGGSGGAGASGGPDTVAWAATRAACPLAT